jgi:hypothetical protein
LLFGFAPSLSQINLLYAFSEGQNGATKNDTHAHTHRHTHTHQQATGKNVLQYYKTYYYMSVRNLMGADNTHTCSLIDLLLLLLAF